MRTIRKNEQGLIVENNFWDFEKSVLLSPIETQNYQIIQAADSYYTQKCNIETHVQPCDLEITYVVYNKLHCHTNGQRCLLQKNDVSLSLREETHKLTSSSVCRFQTLAFNVKTGSPCFPLLERVEKLCHSKEKRKIFLPDVEPFFSQILSELASEPTDEGKLLLDCSITNVFIKLLRRDSVPKMPTTISQKELLPDLTAFLDEYYLRITNLTELSERFGYSYNYLCKIFRQQYNGTIRDYVLSKKMEHAKRLLSEKHSLTEISEALGYSNPYNFSRAFKTHFGVSPKHYAEKNG